MNQATTVFTLPLPLPAHGSADASAPPLASTAAPADGELIERVRRGDRDAFAALYERHSRPVFGVLVRLAGQRALAEEWLQETFVRVWLAAGKHDPQRGAVRAWIFKIAINTARSELARKRHRSPHLSIEERGVDLPDHGAGEPGLAATLDDERRSRALADALDRLPPFMREVIVLRCSHELSFAQIAEVTGAPEGTLKSRFHRAVASLRTMLAPPRRRDR